MFIWILIANCFSYIYLIICHKVTHIWLSLYIWELYSVCILFAEMELQLLQSIYSNPNLISSHVFHINQCNMYFHVLPCMDNVDCIHMYGEGQKWLLAGCKFSPFNHAMCWVALSVIDLRMYYSLVRYTLYSADYIPSTYSQLLAFYIG